jgi:hypothetical protein
LFTVEPGRVGVEGEYLQNEGLVERYKRLSIPVRRALNPTDRAAFAQTAAALRASHGAPSETLDRIDSSWQRLQMDLDSGVMLGGAKVPQRRILWAWLDAVAFYDKLEREHAYDRLIDQYGKAADGISSELTESAVKVILMLDETAAIALGEPVILPPPPKTPPPPPDPKEKWWKRLLPQKRVDE